MTTIQEQCSCGASTTISGRDSLATSSPHRAWLEAHKACRERAAAPLSPPCAPNPSVGFDPSKCPCNPALGGSGVCGCTLGGTRVTC